MTIRSNDSAYIGFSAVACVLAIAGCSHAAPQRDEPGEAQNAAPRANVLEVRSDPATRRPPFEFSRDDAALLDEVQRGSFNWFWQQAHPTTGLVPDRTGVTFASVAGVGFQLSAIPIGIERGWITREEGRDRAERVVRALHDAPSNRHKGVFFHFITVDTAVPDPKSYEVVASTIDSTILKCGLIVASSYFGGEIARLADQLVEEADWSAYVDHSPKEAHYKDFLTLGWKARKPSEPTGDGNYLPFYWADAGDEQRLVTFLAVGSEDASRAVPAETYYRLRRRMGEYGDGPFSWFPWSGALFTSFFAHCWINYADLGIDDPEAQGVKNRVQIDWWENARRAALMHRRKAIENPRKLPEFGEDAWGLSACDGDNTYLVPGLFPREVKIPGARPEMDFATHKPKDDWADGTIAPYTAGSAIMFVPDESIRALRHYKSLTRPDGSPLIWRDPADGGIGFLDSYTPKTGWSAPGCVAIDQGPLILAIENARSGLIWRLFEKHPHVQRSMQRLGLSPSGAGVKRGR